MLATLVSEDTASVHVNTKVSKPLKPIDTTFTAPCERPVSPVIFSYASTSLAPFSRPLPENPWHYRISS